MRLSWWCSPPWCVAAHVLFWAAWMQLSAWRYGGAGPALTQGELGWAVVCLGSGACLGIGAGVWTINSAVLDAPRWALAPALLWGVCSVWLGGLYAWVACVFLGA